MTNIKHLTNNQLTAYYDGMLDEHESHTVGKHLLKCHECRKRLPLLSVEKFLSALLTDDESDEKPIDEKSRFSFLSGNTTFWNLNSSLAFGCAAMVLLSSISIFIWLNNSNPPMDVVQSFEVNNDFITKPEFPVANQTPTNIYQDNSSNTKRVESAPFQKKQNENLTKLPITQNNVSRDLEKKTPTEKPNKVFSATRGVSSKCSENREVEIELSTSKENLVFKWKKVPKAVKYHLYISDDEEILIDEFETETETTFVLKMPLDPLKTYKWKIIITLENGQTLPGPSNKFTVKDFQTKQSKPEKKNSDNRCGEDR
jgi:hypothetical protein